MTKRETFHDYAMRIWLEWAHNAVMGTPAISTQRIRAYWKKHRHGNVPISDAFWQSVNDQQMREWKNEISANQLEN